MAIPQNLIADFELLIEYARAGKIALLETTDSRTGEPVYAIVATEILNGDPLVTPLAKMFIGDPFEQLTPPEDSVVMTPDEVNAAVEKEELANARNFGAPASIH